MKKTLLLIIASTVVALVSAPWLLYAIGLMNVSGRPERAKISITDKEAKILWNELNETGPVHISKIGPWDYILLFGADDPLKGIPGMKAAGFVARDHNSGHLNNKRMGCWHLSGAAVTIWLCRNWTTEDILAKVKEISGRIKEGT